MKYLIIFLLVSCSNLSKKSPDLAWNKKFYWMRIKKKGIIYSRNCKNKIGGKRECKEPEIDLIKEWAKYSPGHIIIPYEMVYP